MFVPAQVMSICEEKCKKKSIVVRSMSDTLWCWHCCQHRHSLSPDKTMNDWSIVLKCLCVCQSVCVYAIFYIGYNFWTISVTVFPYGMKISWVKDTQVTSALWPWPLPSDPGWPTYTNIPQWCIAIQKQFRSNS